MKTIKLLFAALICTAGFVSCSDNNNDDDVIIEENPLEGYNMLTKLTANTHSIEIYSEQDQFTIGYNELFFRIKDDGADTYVSNAEVIWMPVMHMTEMQHSCPKSSVGVTDDASVYSGYVIFQMPGNDTEYWEMTFDYNIDGTSYSVTEKINVLAPADDKRRVTVFTGSDDVRYVLAMMPLDPQVAVNDFSAMLFKMESMMSFPNVGDYSITIDPRMPSMGNHSSPNNVDLSYDASSKMYNGKLSLTMTGYWKINLKVMDGNDTLLKGEDITDENEASSLFFEIEF